MANFSTLAAVDLGSNSFNLQIARVVDNQIYPLDSIREPVAIAAGLTSNKILDAEAQSRALECLQRFGERLRGMDQKAVRAIGTNTLRVAKNSKSFLTKAQNALGFPIEVISGREEARLIYIGVAHSVPSSKQNRLVIDIGGGSTELIVGNQMKPHYLESLFMGCVSYTRMFFPNGRIEKSFFDKAHLAARLELQIATDQFGPENWSETIGASGTLGAIAKIIDMKYNEGQIITPDRLREIKIQLLEVEHWRELDLNGLRNDRKPFFSGGVAIVLALMEELKINKISVTKGAIREGLLYDLLGRFRQQDIREVTIANYKKHYHIDKDQTARVRNLAKQFAKEIIDFNDAKMKHNFKTLLWAIELHEIGFSIGYSGYHKHGAYILNNAEMPGFSNNEQKKLAGFVISHRRSLDKTFSMNNQEIDWKLVLILRLSVLFYRKRRLLKKPDMRLTCKHYSATLSIEMEWLNQNPLTRLALEKEVENWKEIGVKILVKQKNRANVHLGKA